MTTVALRKAPDPDVVSLLCCYDPDTVPAVLHSPLYARAVRAERRRLCLPRGSLDARTLDAIDSQPGRPKVWAVLDLLALRRTPDGDKAALQEQLGHLLDLTSCRVLALQIIPEVPAAPAAPPFTLIRFGRQDRPDAVVLNHAPPASRSRPAARPAQYYAVMFACLAGAASTPAESTRILAARAAGQLH